VILSIALGFSSGAFLLAPIITTPPFCFLAVDRAETPRRSPPFQFASFGSLNQPVWIGPSFRLEKNNEPDRPPGNAQPFPRGMRRRIQRSRRRGPTPAEGGTLIVLNYLETYQPRQAYFAKFEIVLGSAALLYPTRERDMEPIGPGTHRLSGIVPVHVKAQRDLYTPRATGLLNSAPRQVVNATILVVTSDQPLNLEPFLSSSGGLRNQLLSAGATSEQQIQNEIMRIVIQNPESAVWSSDIRSVRIPEAWAGGR